MIDVVFRCPCCVYSPFVALLVVVVSWLNTLYLGIDVCFKLKLKDRGFNNPDLGARLAYMVNNIHYAAHLRKHSADAVEDVRTQSFFKPSNACTDAEAGRYMWLRPPCCQRRVCEEFEGLLGDGSCCRVLPPCPCPSELSGPTSSLITW